MNMISSAALKSTGLATILFWVLLSTFESIEEEIFTLIIISIIPIFIICLAAITFTIMPFYWYEENKLNNKQIFNKYFPYYSITVFGICSYFIIKSNFDNITISFFTTTFFTSISAWIWLFKTNQNEII